MKNTKLKEIYNKIIEDPLNETLIKKGYLPLYQASENSKIVLIGQAPGIKAQESMTLFNDQSGDILRDWLGVTKEEFYNEELFAILPIDFFYPGKAKTGDLPPRKSFAEKWHPEILKEFKNIKLIILIGSYANKFYLKDKMERNLTETVRNYKNYLPKYFPLVHPSPLNFRWQNKNPWFKKENLITLKEKVRDILNNKNN